MSAAYTRHCKRAQAQGFKPLPFHKFIKLAEVLA